MSTNDLLIKYTEMALRDFLKNDAENLLKYHPNEPTFSAKIAMYLHGYIINAKDEFNGISVDCEYDKLEEKQKPSPNGYSHNSIRPDIIVHQRGTCKRNLLFCELKVNELSSNDIKKVNFAMKEPLKYQRGLLIHKFSDNQVTVRWIEKNQCAGCKKLDTIITITEDESNG